VQLGEIQEESGVLGEVVKRHKQGGWSQATLQRRADNQAAQNLKAAAEATAEFCKDKGCKGLILAGAEGVVGQFRAMLPKKLQKEIIGAISADMTTQSDEILRRSMAVWLATKHAQEAELVEQAITAAAKAGMGVTGLADTTYAVRQGRVHVLLVEQGYEAPGAVCGHCGYVSPAVGQKCLFCSSEMNVVDNAVDIALQKTLDAGGKVSVVEGSKHLAEAGHIAAILRY
jgi:peptide chain release factor subunit 1